jgi:MYXO-CTERM domain-containing protein
VRSSPLSRLAIPLSLIVGLGCEAPPANGKLSEALQPSPTRNAFPKHPTPPPSAFPKTHGATGPVPAGAWTTNTVPFAAASTSMLLTDGRVMCQNENATDWWMLTPDAKGQYVTGTWSQAASMSKARLYYASAVLMDGRVAVFGGEYTGGSTPTEDDTAEVYDPVQNSWSALTAPPGWTMIGDAPNTVLPNGQILVGGITDTNTEIWDPSGTWSFGGTKLGNSGEETWILLPDGSVLTVDCDLTRRTGKSELWVSSPTPTWTDVGGSLPVDIVDATLNEIGPAMLLADGRVVFFGGTGNTALYTPSPTPRQPGTWAAGPVIPPDPTGVASVARDTPAVLLPNNHVLLTASSPTNGGWGGPTAFFDVDPTDGGLAMTLIPDAGTPINTAGPPYEGRLLLLPSGEVMYTQGTPQASFLPPVAPVTTYAPSITQAPTFAPPGSSFTLTGLRLNGLSQAVIYGDDESAATNYPLVRLTDSNNNVFYARTHDHSTMAVATGTTPETTQVTIPASLPIGAYQMQVVVNGVASASQPIQISNIKPPTLALTAPVGGANVDGTVAVNATASPATGTTLTGLTLKIDGAQVAGGATSPQSYNWDTTALANGSTHAVLASATDADTGAASATATVTVKNNPLVAFTGLADGGSVHGTAAIAATASAPNGTSLASLAISLDGVQVVTGAASPETYGWTTTSVPNGSSHALVATATDVDGTTASSAIQVVVRNAPTVALTAPVDASTVSGKVGVNATATALQGTTLSSLAIAIDGTQVATGATSPATYAWDTTALNNGSSHTVTATATDADGTSATATSTVTVQNNPAVAVVSPADGTKVSGPVVVKVTGTAAAGTTLTALAMTIDGAQAISGSSSPQTFSWDSRNDANGSSHVIVAIATDQDGTTASATSNVTVANLPTVQITAPTPGSNVSGTVTLTATATAPTGTTLSTLSIAVDGTQVGSGTTSPFSFSWSTDGISGSHTVTAKAVDADGSNATSATVTVTVGGSSTGGGKSGCGCGTGNANGAALGMGALALLVVLARRRKSVV